MTDGVITIVARDTEDGTAISAAVGEPLNQTYDGLVQGGQFVLLIPAADLLEALGSTPLCAYTLDDGSGDPDVVIERFRVDDSGAVDISVGPLVASGSSQSFTIEPRDSEWLYGFWVGNNPDLADANAAYFDSGVLTSSNVITAQALPIDGRAMYMRVAIDKQDGSDVSLSMIEITAHTGVALEASVLKLTNTTTTSNSARDLHAYSTVQAFNADETLVNLLRWNGAIYNIDGTVAYTGMPYGTLANQTDSFFDVTNPFKLWGTDGSNLSYVDVRDDPPVQTVVYTGPGGLFIGGTGGGSSQGSPNDDCTKILVNTSSTMYIIDMTDGSVIRSLARPSGFDWAGMSHTGDYFVVVSTSADMQIYRTSDGTLIRNLTGSTYRNHGDFAKASGGVEYFTMVGNPPKQVQLSDGAVTNLGSSAKYGHISGRSFNNVVGYSSDGAQTVGRTLVGDDFDADLAEFTLLPTTVTGGDSITQMRVSMSRTGTYALVTINSAVNVPNTYLVTWGAMP